MGEIKIAVVASVFYQKISKLLLSGCFMEFESLGKGGSFCAKSSESFADIKGLNCDCDLKHLTAFYKNAKISTKLFVVSGCLEVPQVLTYIAESSQYDAAVALGCVIKGETDHYEHVSRVAMDGVASVSSNYSLPIGNGILTVDTEDKALCRADPKLLNKGGEAARSALEVLFLRASIASSDSLNNDI